MKTSDAQRRAIATYEAKRKESGSTKVSFWLSPEAQESLAKLREIHGSKDAAISAVLKAALEKLNSDEDA